MTNTALYIRVSHEEQALHGLSIDAQLEALEAYARANGLKIAGRYVDAGISARKKHTNRPELIRLLDDIKAGNIDLVLFTKLDRWFRNVSEYYKVQEILDAYKVPWRAIHEDYETATASGQLKVNIMLAVNQNEADRTAERVKAVFDSKKSRKEPVSGNMPTGYILSGKTIEYDPEWYDAVQIFFTTYLTTGVPIKARQAVERQTGKSISYQLGNLILRNRAYCGEFNGTKGMCPPYITEQQYEDIQKMRQTHPRYSKKREYMFSGLVYCAECGFRLSSCGQYSKHADGTKLEIHYYLCQSHYNRKICKNNACTAEKYVEEEVLRQFPLKVIKAVEEADNKRSASKENTEQDLAKAKRRLSKLQELYLNDLIDMNSYKAEYDGLQKQITELSAKPLQDVSKLQELLDMKWMDFYSKFNIPSKRAFWQTYISKICIDVQKNVSLELKIL